MWVLLAGVLALWTLAAVFVLAICRAAARADENEGRRLIRAGRRGATVSLAAAAATLSAGPGEASARQACANRDVEFQAAPPLVRDALLCEIARVRARHDVRRLRLDPQLDLVAARHATDMFER